MANEHLKYRPDIDGLRAIAVLAVIFFHADIGIPGGFVGVDVFFVISGYLITSLIVRDLRAGTFSILGFFERRIRRIVPALVVMVVAVLGAGWFLLLPSAFIDLGRSATAVAALVANFYFWQTTGGYFSTSVEELPLLHTWSLAVEEQFYLVVPVVLVILFRFSLLRRNCILLPLIAISLFASLSYSVHAVKAFPAMAFFFPTSRAWELLCGSFIALLPVKVTAAPRFLREVLGYAGLVGVIAPCFLLSKSTHFPGMAAIAPCAGSALILLANQRNGAVDGQTSHALLLGCPPVAFVGLISYSLYLWHWPLLAFTRYWSIGVIPFSTRITLLIVAFLLATVSWRFVESPFRQRAVFAGRQSLFCFALSSFALVLAFAGYIVFSHGYPPRLPASVLEYAASESDIPTQYHKKSSDIQSDNLPRFGHADKPPSLLLWGDSQGYCMLPAFNELANHLGIVGVAITHGARPPVLGGFSGNSFGEGKDLPEWGDEAVRYVVAHHIKETFLAGFWQAYFNLEHGEKFPEAMIRTIRALNSVGSRVWIIKQIPSHGNPPPKYLARFTLFNGEKSPPPDTSDLYLSQIEPMNQLERATRGLNVHFLDPAPLFFNPTNSSYCIEKNGKSLYYDPIHVTSKTSETIIAPWLHNELAGKLAPSD